MISPPCPAVSDRVILSLPFGLISLRQHRKEETESNGGARACSGRGRVDQVWNPKKGSSPAFPVCVEFPVNPVPSRFRLRGGTGDPFPAGAGGASRVSEPQDMVRGGVERPYTACPEVFGGSRLFRPGLRQDLSGMGQAGFRSG